MSRLGWYSRIQQRVRSKKVNELLNSYIGDMELPGFSQKYYCDKYPDVLESGLDPLSHYLLHGWLEGRDPSAGFSTSSYLLANPDVADGKINPLLHFLRHGIAEGPRRLAGRLLSRGEAGWPIFSGGHFSLLS